MSRLRSIDVLRGLAASAVVLHHVGGGWTFGAIGVDFFFVISGFVMAQTSQGKSAGQFMADRAWRIYPPYLALIGPLILLALFSGQIGPIRAAGSLLLWPHWLGVPADYYLVAWTLTYELAFYAAFALAIHLRSAWLPLMVFALALLMRPLTDNPLVNFAGSPIILEFLAGVLIAWLPVSRDHGLPLAIIGILSLALFPNTWLHDATLAQGYATGFARAVLWGIPAALIIYGFLAFENVRWPRWSVGLGAMSYSLYLVHPLVAFQLDLPWSVELCLSIAAGWAAWRLVERPLLQLRQLLTIWRRRPADGKVSVSTMMP